MPGAAAALPQEFSSGPNAAGYCQAWRLLQSLIPPAEHDRVWLVGGCVRDMLLGRALKDIDLLAALPADIFSARGFRPVEAKTSPPIWFRHAPGIGNLEVTLLDGSGSLAADLQRRDFTINALALSLGGELSDPLNGRVDLKERRLRACSAGTFADDPLRIFRAFRFEAEGFPLWAGSADLIADRDWEEALRSLPVERFSREMLKALAAPFPQRFFAGMVRFGVGRGWLPGLFQMEAIPAGPLQHHPEGDLLSHSLEVLERVAAMTPLPLARFCAFFHDIGKLATPPENYPKHHGHDEAGFQAAPVFCRELALPLAYGKGLAWVSRLHGKLNRFAELRPATRLRLVENALKAGIGEVLPLVSAADKPGGYSPGDWQRVVAVAVMNLDELQIGRERLLAMEPSNRAAFILQQRVERLRQQADSV